MVAALTPSDTSGGPMKTLVLRQDAGTSLDQLWNNRDVQAVSLEFDGTDEEYLTVFRSLAHHRQMTTLRVCDLTNPLPVKALSAVINDPASRLCHITLEGISLSGKAGEYMAFVEALRLCSLQSVQIDGCEFVNKQISLDPLIRALSTIPTLERVYLSDTKVAPEGIPWDCRYLHLLVTQIRSLTLNEMPDIQYEQICVLARALEDPACALKELTIQDQALDSKCIQRIAQMLEKNTSLEELCIDVGCAHDVGVIARSLNQHQHRQQHKQQQQQQQQQQQHNDEKGPYQHEHHQHYGSNLKRLAFLGDWGQEQEELYSDVRRALLKMVQTNTSIVDLILGDDDNDLSAEISQYIKMNLDSQRALFGDALRGAGAVVVSQSN